jgi:hypothetical protein
VGYVLQALALQQLRACRLKVVLWDEGPVPITNDRWIRLLVDLLGERGHDFNYLRRTRSSGVASARYGLLHAIPDDATLILLVDDDLVPMPDAIQLLLDSADGLESFGFLQGSKLELDAQRAYANDMNSLNRRSDETGLTPIVFGDAAFLLVTREAIQQVRWDIVTRFQQEGMGGEDVAMSLMMADRFPCFGVPRAVGYHLSLQTPRWRWEASSDALQIELLRGVVSVETLKRAMPHLAHTMPDAGG